MAWEKRGNNEYYYRKRRVGKRVVSDYIGNGELAEMFAEMDEWERLESEQERRAFRQEKARQRRLDREIDALGDDVRALTRASYLVAGYHTHKGSWRKKRRSRDE